MALDTPNPEKKEGIAVFYHAWPFVGMSKTDFEKLKEVAREPFYDIIVNDTPLDNVFGNILKDVGKKVIMGSKIRFPFDLLIKGDTVFQVYFDKEFTKRYYELFTKYKQLEALSVGELMEKMLIQKTKITMLQIEDANLADKIRNEVLAEFNRKN